MRASAAASLMLISIHALREEGDDKIILDTLTIAKFLSTPSARRATLCENFNGMTDDISIHALREEGDFPFSSRQTCFIQFLSTPSARRATLNACCFFSGVRPISIHALREEGDDGVIAGQLAPVISIHALREEGDIWGAGNPTPHMISIHALREEGDDVQSYDRSTELISIHALREEGDFWMLSYCCCKTISIHALREEGDSETFWGRLRRQAFLSTPSARRATNLHIMEQIGYMISIHALREEGDVLLFQQILLQGYFYPRPPRGGRQQKQRQNLYFQTNYTTFCTNLEEP